MTRSGSVGVVGFVMSFVALSATAAHAGADPSAVAKAMRAVLAATPIVAEADLDATVPDAVKPHLQTLRDTLRALVEADLATVSSAPPKVESFEELRKVAAFDKRIAARLTAAGIALGASDADPKPTGLAPRWGRIQSVHAWLPLAAPRRLAVDVTWGMPCGTDTTTWLFEPRAGHWALILVDEAPNFDADNYEVAIVGSATPGDVYLFSASTPVWCTSVWSALRYKVLAPGATPTTPTNRFAAEASANRGCGALHKLAAEKGTITFRFVGAKVDDPTDLQGYEVRLGVTASGVTPIGEPTAVPGTPPCH